MNNLLFLVVITIPILLLPTSVLAQNNNTNSTAGNFDNKTFDKCYKKINNSLIEPPAGINETRAALQLFKTNHTVPTNGLLLEEISLVNICMVSGMAK